MKPSSAYWLCFPVKLRPEPRAQNAMNKRKSLNPLINRNRTLWEARHKQSPRFFQLITALQHTALIIERLTFSFCNQSTAWWDYIQINWIIFDRSCKTAWEDHNRRILTSRNHESNDSNGRVALRPTLRIFILVQWHIAVAFHPTAYNISLADVLVNGTLTKQMCFLSQIETSPISFNELWALDSLLEVVTTAVENSSAIQCT